MADNTNDLLLLSDICEKVLNLKFDVARRWHALGKLPLPAFRLGSAKRGPLYVHKDDVEQHIAARRNHALARVRNKEKKE